MLTGLITKMSFTLPIPTGQIILMRIIPSTIWTIMETIRMQSIKTILTITSGQTSIILTGGILGTMRTMELLTVTGIIMPTGLITVTPIVTGQITKTKEEFIKIGTITLIGPMAIQTLSIQIGLIIAI